MDNINHIQNDEYLFLVSKCISNKSKFSYKYFYNYKNSQVVRKFRIYLDSNRNLFYFDENNNINYLKKIVKI
jgi:hypothetical protein